MTYLDQCLGIVPICLFLVVTLWGLLTSLLLIQRWTLRMHSSFLIWCAKSDSLCPKSCGSFMINCPQNLYRNIPNNSFLLVTGYGSGCTAASRVRTRASLTGSG